MKVAQINVTCGKGSTGKICYGISRVLTDLGIENRVYYSAGFSDYSNSVRYMSKAQIKTGALMSRIFGNWGFNSVIATARLIGQLKAFDPDIVHMHNMHGHNCNLSMLFGYLKKTKTKVVWTFHDCWAYTGYCMHYDMIGCLGWQKECGNCPQKREYSWLFDKSKKLLKKKKKLLEELDLTVVTPSRWLANEVRSSFLNNKPIKVIPNGIDLSVFTAEQGSFREQYGLEDKYIVLGVAFDWSERKGIDVFLRLSQTLPSDYQIVLVGTNAEIDKSLTDNIISIHRTQNQQELAGIYAAADVFVNPTREENYPTVNMEALASGTPVLTFRTGGSPEMVDDTCGVTVKKNDVDSLEREIIRACSERLYDRSSCLKKSRSFDMHERFRDYVELYEGVLNDGTTK